MTRRTSAGRPSPASHFPAIPFEHQPELRALMMFPTLPPGHMTFPVPDDAFYPHLRRGEFAVVDLADHQPAEGELFLISYRSLSMESGHVYALCAMRLKRSRVDPARTSWYARHSLPEAGVRATLSEGPFTTEHAAERLVGRVEGVWVPGAAARGASAS
ncbi:hypothetical protein Xaut_3424 [Xanthobacter versatilis]|uniref:Uncharacterized protein n=1 Tax=Xanthobacter autotrophicus (strain ATCC BAA-1158 / Py2) TaxID=78245 RepID=A7IKW0_XANP2|nr:hypothetical protein Xaut_3424 [Xanthobacter autotrophicus Py2]